MSNSDKPYLKKCSNHYPPQQTHRWLCYHKTAVDGKGGPATFPNPLQEFPAVRQAVGGTMADLDDLMERYGPWMTIGAARDLELERRSREGRA